MIGRRGLIVGLVSLVAAPAIVRARISRDGPYTLYTGEELECRHFDFTNGGGHTAFHGCRLSRCTFAADSTTKTVNLEWCLLEDTDLAPLLAAVPPAELLLRDNHTTTLAGRGEKCTAPRS